MMSSKRRAGLSEGKGAVSVDFQLKPLLAHWLFDDVHPAAQNAGRNLFELAQRAEISKPSRSEIFAGAYGHIDIVRGIVPRATEPNKETLDTPAVPISCSCAFNAAMTSARSMEPILHNSCL